jgi:hypothetical protein
LLLFWQLGRTTATGGGKHILLTLGVYHRRTGAAGFGLSLRIVVIPILLSPFLGGRLARADTAIGGGLTTGGIIPLI